MTAVGVAVVAVVAGLYGLVIGSVLNIAIHRVSPHLPGCGTRVAGRRGRCRGCVMPIPARYPLVEALTGGLFVLVVLRFGLSPTLPAMLVFVAGLTALACCGLNGLVLPKRIVYPTGIMVAVALMAAATDTDSWHRLAVAASCGAGAFVVFFAIHLASPRAMGFGDVRLAPLVSGTLGWLGIRYAVVGFLLANVLGAVIGLALIAAGRGSRKTALPYGALLAVGAVVALPLGDLVQ